LRQETTRKIILYILENGMCGFNEIIIYTKKVPSTISSHMARLKAAGSLNGMEIPRNTILIDDYSDQHNRIVHIVIPNFKLKEFTNQIITSGGN
jgi:DNA-binding transcriptional ArsR family regulator